MTGCKYAMSKSQKWFETYWFASLLLCTAAKAISLSPWNARPKWPKVSPLVVTHCRTNDLLIFKSSDANAAASGCLEMAFSIIASLFLSSTEAYWTAFPFSLIAIKTISKCLFRSSEQNFSASPSRLTNCPTISSSRRMKSLANRNTSGTCRPIQKSRQPLSSGNSWNIVFRNGSSHSSKDAAYCNATPFVLRTDFRTNSLSLWKKYDAYCNAVPFWFIASQTTSFSPLSQQGAYWIANPLLHTAFFTILFIPRILLEQNLRAKPLFSSKRSIVLSSKVSKSSTFAKAEAHDSLQISSGGTNCRDKLFLTTAATTTSMSFLNLEMQYCKALPLRRTASRLNFLFFFSCSVT